MTIVGTHTPHLMGCRMRGRLVLCSHDVFNLQDARFHASRTPEDIKARKERLAFAVATIAKPDSVERNYPPRAGTRRKCCKVS